MKGPRGDGTGSFLSTQHPLGPLMRNLGILALVIGFLALTVWAVSFGTLPPADFTFSNGSEIKTVDPAIVTGQPEGRIIWAIFEGLVARDPKDSSPVPGVATHWDLSEDKLTYEFHLRHNAKWSDGSPVTSEDFVWSMRRFLHPATAAEYSYEMWYIDGAEQFTTMQVAEGDAVEVELLTRPDGALPYASGEIVHGTLRSIDDATEPPTYIVEIEEDLRTFRKGGAGDDPQVEDYQWLLKDFRTVGCWAPDRWTVCFRLKHPVPYFPSLLAFYPMSPVNRRCIETHGFPEWTRPENLVTNGPFMLKFRRVRDRIRLEKNPHYWDRENVHLDTIDALAVESNTTNLNLYLTGQADWIPSVPPEVVTELMARPDGDFRPSPYLSTYYYILNTEEPPLNDVRVRQALSLAVDREEICDAVLRSGQEPTYSIVPPEISKYIDYEPPQAEPYNVARARQLLGDAGYPQGRGFPRIDILYNTLETHQMIAEVIQSQWKRHLGIDVGLRNQEWGAYQASRRQGTFHVARAGWIGDYVDPNTFLELFVTGNPNNHSRYSNARYDNLIELAHQEPDAAKRLEYFAEAERILMEELPIIPLYAYVTQNMVRPYVKGFYWNLQDIHPLKDIRIDQAEKQRIMARPRY